MVAAKPKRTRHESELIILGAIARGAHSFTALGDQTGIPRVELNAHLKRLVRRLVIYARMVPPPRNHPNPRVIASVHYELSPQGEQRLRQGKGIPNMRANREVRTARAAARWRAAAWGAFSLVVLLGHLGLSHLLGVHWGILAVWILLAAIALGYLTAIPIDKIRWHSRGTDAAARRIGQWRGALASWMTLVGKSWALVFAADAGPPWIWNMVDLVVLSLLIRVEVGPRRTAPQPPALDVDTLPTFPMGRTASRDHDDWPADPPRQNRHRKTREKNEEVGDSAQEES